MCGGLVVYNTDISSKCWRGGQRWDTLKPSEFVTVNVAKIHLCWTAGKRALQSPCVTSKAGHFTYIYKCIPDTCMSFLFPITNI